MPLLLAIVVLYFPRLLLLWLKFFTGWFAAVQLHLVWQVLGFFFAPFTLLWYTVVANEFGGQWGLLQKALLILAIVIDLGGGFGALRKRN